MRLGLTVLSVLVASSVSPWATAVAQAARAEKAPSAGAADTGQARPQPQSAQSIAEPWERPPRHGRLGDAAGRWADEVDYPIATVEQSYAPWTALGYVLGPIGAFAVHSIHGNRGKAAAAALGLIGSLLTGWLVAGMACPPDPEAHAPEPGKCGVAIAGALLAGAVWITIDLALMSKRHVPVR